MVAVKLDVEKREILGRKVKKLRAEGKLPANVFGKKVKSVSIVVPSKKFELVFEKVGETRLVDLEVKGEKESRPVLVHNVQRDPISDSILHIDFHQVDLKEKTTASVPLEFIGEAGAVADKKGLLVKATEEVEVEALPTDLPETIEVDISSLKEVDQMILAKDLRIDLTKVKLLTDPERVIAKIELPTKEKEVLAPAAEVEGEEAAEAGGEAGAGEEEGKQEAGEKKAEETVKEKK